MTSLQLHLQARTAMDVVPWDNAREQRVLVGALDARRGRARRRWALELVAAMMVTFVAGRFLPRASVESSEVRPAFVVPAAEVPAEPDGDRHIPRSAGAAKPTKTEPLGGFAGTGGHGGTGSNGHGGSAGTG